MKPKLNIINQLVLTAQHGILIKSVIKLHLLTALKEIRKFYSYLPKEKAKRIRIKFKKASRHLINKIDDHIVRLEVPFFSLRCQSSNQAQVIGSFIILCRRLMVF